MVSQYQKVNMMGDKKEDRSANRDIEMLFAAVMPNARFFENKFDVLQLRVGVLEKGQEDFKEQLKHFEKSVDHRFSEFKLDMRDRFEQVDKRFEQVDKRFEQVDKRFEQVDKRFEEVDKRFDHVDKRLEQVISSIDKLGDKLDHRDEKQRGFTIRMFTIAITVSAVGVLGAFLKSFGII